MCFRSSGARPNSDISSDEDEDRFPQEHLTVVRQFQDHPGSRNWLNPLETSSSYRTALKAVHSRQLPASSGACDGVVKGLVSDGNELHVRVTNIRDLLSHAKEKGGNTANGQIKTEPTKMKIKRGVKMESQLQVTDRMSIIPDLNEGSRGASFVTNEPLTCEDTVTKREREIEMEVVLKLFLSGTVDSTGTFVFICLSIKMATNENLAKGFKQNGAEQEEGSLIVSVYLKHPNADENAHRRDFKMKFSPALEKGEKGLLKFIDKKELEKYIAHDNSVDICLSIQFESSL